jgi:predicted DNA-binding transcriptional regulator
MGTWIGTPQRSRTSLAAKYQSRCSRKISQIFSGFFGGDVAQLERSMMLNNEIRKGLINDITSVRYWIGYCYHARKTTLYQLDNSESSVVKNIFILNETLLN